MLTIEKLREVNAAIGYLAGALTYLMETRDCRKKGTKLAAEQILFDCLQLVTRQ